MSSADDLQLINSHWDALKDDIFEFAQGPSDFQIEVFMARGEGPPEHLPTHAYRHMLAQVRPTLSELRRLKIDQIRTERKLEDMKAAVSGNKVPFLPEARKNRIKKFADDPDLDLLIMETEQSLEDNLISQKGKQDQYKTMKKILEHIKTNTDGALTNERLQEEEWKYWMIRLARQAINSAEGAASGVGSGNLNSIRNAMEGSPLENSPHRIPVIPVDKVVLGHLAVGDEDLIEFLKTDGKSGKLPEGVEVRRTTRSLPGDTSGEGDGNGQ